MLNDMFSRFDELTEKHGVYKVETIGDAYMVAAGHLPEDTNSGAARVLSFAKDMIKAMEDVYSPKGSLQIRVGVHCGPAHSGVVGTKMPRYCFFGDTVNTASRMESTGFPSCIQCSNNILSMLQQPGEDDDGIYGQSCFFEYGKRAIKGKGEMTTYLLKIGDWKVAVEEKKREALASANGEENRLAQRKKSISLLSETYQRVKFR